MRNKFLLLFGRRSSLLQQVGQAHRIVGASFPSHGNFPLDNRSGPCYARQRGLDIPDVSPEGNPLPRRPEFEPSAGRPSLFPIEGGHILCGRGGMADAPDLGSGAPVAYGFKSLRPHHFIRSGTCGSSSVVECHLAKVDVASSNLVYRSTDCGCSSMVELQPSKLATWVRFPSPAPVLCTSSSVGRAPDS